jgi:hypothetical protein
MARDWKRVQSGLPPHPPRVVSVKSALRVPKANPVRQCVRHARLFVVSTKCLVISRPVAFPAALPLKKGHAMLSRHRQQGQGGCALVRHEKPKKPDIGGALFWETSNEIQGISGLALRRLDFDRDRGPGARGR